MSGRVAATPQPITIDRFITGLYTRRNQLLTPFRAVGINVVQFHDALIDGLNIEVSDNATLQRRPGFVRFCSQAFGPSEFPLQYSSFRDLNGNVYPLVDTNQNFSSFTSSAITSLVSKSTTAQGFCQGVGNTLYYANGVDLKKWSAAHGTSNWGISTPITAPTLAYVANGQLNPTAGYSYVYVAKNGATGHPSTASPASANTGPLKNQTLSENAVATGITNVSVNGSNVVTVTCKNNFQPGQSVAISALTAATFLNGQTLTVATSSTTQFTATFTHAAYGPTADSGTAVMTVTVPNSPYQYTVQFGASFVSDGGVAYSSNSQALTVVASSPVAGQYSVNAATGQYTFAAADVGKGLVITYVYSLAVSAFINIQVSGSGHSDPQVNFIDIYRIKDGGSVYYYLATVANPGGGNVWTFTDSIPDSGLNTSLTPPLAHLNDPPLPGGTILAWWQGRLWMASGNNVYFNAGPDCLNGVPEEAWPPANVFTFAGKVTGFAPTSVGLVVFTSDEIYIILGGPQTLTFYDQTLLPNFGISSPNCLDQDGDQIFLYTTGRQYWSMNTTQKSEDGQRVGDILSSTFNPATSYVSMFRNGEDTGVFLSDGSTNSLRYGLNTLCWSPKYQVVGGAGPIKGIETSLGTYSLMTGRTTGGGYILARSLTTFTDDGAAYSANATVGSITVSQPGQPLVPLWHVLGYFAALGTVPAISVLPNEISATNGAQFTLVPKYVNEPPIGAAQSQSMSAYRYQFDMNTQGVSQLIHHVQVKVDFGTDTVKNELLTLGLKFDND